MTDDATATDGVNYVELAADIVSAYVSNNSLPTSDLPSLIGAVHAALRQVTSPLRPRSRRRPPPFR